MLNTVIPILIAVVVAGESVRAELIIKLKNGQVHRLPVSAEEVESMTFRDGARETPAEPLAGPAPQAPPQVIQVGPERLYKTPRAAVRAARNGDTVEIDAGVYQGDVAVWPQNNLTLRGVGGRAHLQAQGKAAQGKAIWVIRGNRVTVENMEFSGARVRDKNGAGIRFEGRHLTIRNSYFHDNEMGILTDNKSNSDILIEGSELANNTVDYERYGSLGHNIYIGRVRRFTLRNSYIHDAQTGHNVKSRARQNYILYNRITDENAGSSYLVDLTDGGMAYLIGNLFQQSPRSDNFTLIAFATEKNRENPKQSLYVINNTFVNDHQNGVFVNNSSVAPATLVNNFFVGPGTLLAGAGELNNNLRSDAPGFQDRAAYNYRLLPGSPAIDKGIDPAQTAAGVTLRPDSQYVHPLRSEPRPQRGPLDMGAYEFSEP